MKPEGDDTYCFLANPHHAITTHDCIQQRGFANICPSCTENITLVQDLGGGASPPSRPRDNVTSPVTSICREMCPLSHGSQKSRREVATRSVQVHTSGSPVGGGRDSTLWAAARNWTLSGCENTLWRILSRRKNVDGERLAQPLEDVNMIGAGGREGWSALIEKYSKLTATAAKHVTA